MPSIRKNPAPAKTPTTTAQASVRRRLLPSERQRQIVEGAVRFFSDHGLDGQLRDLARGLGITHTLLYHYFPTKQALIERVYSDLFEGRWRPEWEDLLDDKRMDIETRLTRFYGDYAAVILKRDWVRIFIHSGLSERYITDRYFSLLHEKLFPRLVRESRRYIGRANRGKPTAREMELVMGLHGSIFYMGMRRWVYGHAMIDSRTEPFDEVFIRDRVRSYLLSLEEVFPADAARTSHFPARTKPLEEISAWPLH
jgi:AcrR family transcriptional regulator